MKKLNVGIILVVLSVFLATACYAKPRPLAYERIWIGGITPGSTPAEVQKIYGKPDKVLKKSNDDPFVDHVYRNFFRITYYDDVDGMYVRELEVTNNRVATLDKVRLGMPESALKRIYGTPGLLKRIGKTKKYLYLANDYAPGTGNISLWFDVENGKIKTMGIFNNE